MVSKADAPNCLVRRIDELDLRAEIPFELMLPCGKIEGEAMIYGFEREIGMLIITDLSQLGGLSQHLPQFGYEHYLMDRNELLAMRSVDWKKLLCTWRWVADATPPQWYHFNPS